MQHHCQDRNRHTYDWIQQHPQQNEEYRWNFGDICGDYVG